MTSTLRGEDILDCVFCERIKHGQLLAHNALAVALRDAFPLTPGHCLIVPRRHEPDFLALAAAEQSAMWSLIGQVRQVIEVEESMPDGYNIGINVGEAAGQTVAHAHLHVIPRHRGDVPDPRGGVRCVMPDKARYWENE